MVPTSIATVLGSPRKPALQINVSSNKQIKICNNETIFYY